MPIKQIPKDVVNKIAAGEVICRPVNALKELIENSLDAGATSLSITVGSGGLSQIVIQDNGSGIAREDMALLCRRFTTSKLSNVDDLNSLTTYGFRGEALASMSCVARLSVISRTKEESLSAHKATYKGGEMQGELVSVAGSHGTIITVNDLFYNMPMRLKAIRSQSEEQAAITDLISKYAINRPHVSFILRKSGESVAKLRCAPQPGSHCTLSAQTIAAIRTIYGNIVARELVELTESASSFGVSRLHGFVSGPNTIFKKLRFIFFVNGRLVDPPRLLRAELLDSVFGRIMPKQHSQAPFIYLALDIQPGLLDVNIHPTKNEVRLLHEEETVRWVCDKVRALLEAAQHSRTFTVSDNAFAAPTMSSLPSKDASGSRLYDSADREAAPCNGTRDKPTTSVAAAPLGKTKALQAPSAAQTQQRPEFNVRVDPRERKLERFFGVSRSFVGHRSFLKEDGEFRNCDPAGTSSNSVLSASISSESRDQLQLHSTASNRNLFAARCDDVSEEAVTAFSGSTGLPCDAAANKENTNPRDEKTRFSGCVGREPAVGSAQITKISAGAPVEDEMSLIENLSSAAAEEGSGAIPPHQRTQSGDYVTMLQTASDASHSSRVTSSSASQERKEGTSTGAAYRDVKLSSVLELRTDLRSAQICDRAASQLFRDLSYVGCVDETHLIFQVDVKLYICPIAALTTALFYQLALERFANFGRVCLSPPLNLEALLCYACDREDGRCRDKSFETVGSQQLDDGVLYVDFYKRSLLSDGETKEGVAREGASLLLERHEMLDDYFSIKLSRESACMESIPLILLNHTPQMSKLPVFLLRLVKKVVWTEEKACFKGICVQLAWFYAHQAHSQSSNSATAVASCSESTENSTATSTTIEATPNFEHILEHTLCSALRPLHVPHWLSRELKCLVSLSDVYKVFERC